MLTETCILMEAANNLVESQTATNFEIQNYVIPLISIISIIATVFIACYNAKKTKEITEVTLETTTKNLILQLNQDEIKESIKELTEGVTSGEVKRVRDFLDFEKGVYIPPSLKEEIKENLYLFSMDKGLENDLNKMDGGSIPEKLKKEFENREISLPTNLIVTKKGATWEITDNKKEKIHYTIRKAKREITDNKKEKIHYINIRKIIRKIIRKKKRELNIYGSLNGELDSAREKVILDLINKYISP